MEHAREIQLRRQLQRREAEAADAEVVEGLGVGAAGEHVRDGLGGGVLGEQGRLHGLHQRAVEGGLDGLVGVHVLAADVRAEQPVEVAEELLLVAGQEAAVDVRGGLAGDDVDLVTGVELGGVGGVAQGRADQLGDAAELGDRGLHVLRVQLGAERVAQLVEEGPGGLGDPHRELVPADPGDGLGQLGDGVVPVDHGAVPGGAGHGELHPVHALLGRLDQIEPPLLVHGEGEAADLADRLGDALEQLGVVVDQVPGAVGAARLLVGEEGDHDVPRGPPPAAQPVAHDGEGHGVHVLHVDRPASPHAPVGDLPGEGVVGPVVGVGRHHVQVAVDQQGGPGRVLPRDAGHGGGAARVRLVDLGLQADLGELLGDPLGGLALAGPGVVAVVAGVEPDQLAAEVHDLVLAGDALGRVRLAHAASSRLPCWWTPSSSLRPRPGPKTGPGPSHAVHAGPARERGVIGHPRKPGNVSFVAARETPPREAHARQTPCPGGGMADALA
ncbi:hypothetical protein SGPA1_20140 [Streptomyces misionensis JCM 4497]